MKIIHKMQDAMAEDRIFYSFEYFPPKTESGIENLYDRLERMSNLRPDFIDVTWGAGGSTAELTLEICSTAQNLLGFEVMMHLTCTNMPEETLRETLLQARRNGLQNILALRGDPPRGAEGWKQVEGGFGHAIDLVKFIRKEHGDYFGICVAGYPEGHVDCISYEEDLQHLKAKVDAGADFIITQLFYDAQEFLKFVRDCRSLGIKCPIIPGIMPINNYASFKRMTAFCKTKVPEQISSELESIKDNDEAVKAYGIKLAIQMCRTLMANGIRGLHFYTLNLEKSVTEILQGLDISAALSSSSPSEPQRALPWKAASSANLKRVNENVRPIYWANRPKAYMARTMSWDEFPNGRWGDSRSPAFGDIESTAPWLIHRKPEDRRGMWGEAPQKMEDIANVFVGYLTGAVARLPWSDTPLALESGAIRDSLTRLNQAGFLTINSQPRVNGVRSDDPTFGWGGSGGYVYQKAYVEFFCSPEMWSRLKTVLDAKYPSLTYQCVNKRGDVAESNAQGVNAATWGVFPGREIIQPTIVDPVSFSAWKDEAFSLWTAQWAELYPEGSDSRRLIEGIANSWVLVDIVDNDFVVGNIFAPFEEVISQGVQNGIISSSSSQ